MSGKPEQYQELGRLIAGLLEGQLSETERARLEELLRGDAKARQLYMQMVDQEVELSCLLVPGGTQGDVRGSMRGNILPFEEKTAGRHAAARRRHLPRWLAAAAVVMVLATALAVVILRERNITPGNEAPAGMASGTGVDESWSEDFEKGLPAGWIGTLVSTNLPPGSKYALATGLQHWPEGVSHVISLPADWDEGLFALTERSTLHLTYRFARGSHVNVFLHGLTGRAEPPSMFQLRPGEFPKPGRDWQTAAIPFSSFVRKVPSLDGRMEFTGGPPEKGERVAVLAFSWVEPIDFVIDRIWVTPTHSTPTQPSLLNPNKP